MRLEGKTALVTGGSRGIGRAIVELLCKEGAKVAFVYRSNEEAAKEVVDAVSAAGGEAVAIQGDVGNADDPDRIVSEVIGQFGKLDILVNNAGIIRDTPMPAMKDEEWTDVITTNLSSVFRFCKAVARPMRKARSGRIINMSSVAAATPNPGQANYAASKGGVESFTRCVSKELAKKGVTVNAVAPGFIATDMTTDVRNSFGEQIEKAVPLQRLGQPEDIANAVLFLSCDEASYITGQVITVDGGLSLGSMV